MSSRQLYLIVVAAVGIGLMLTPAFAFNPQPDPPANGRVRVDKTKIDKTGVKAKRPTNATGGQAR